MTSTDSTGFIQAHLSDVSQCQQASMPIALIFHMADIETCDELAMQIFYELFESYRVCFPFQSRFFASTLNS